MALSITTLLGLTHDLRKMTLHGPGPNQKSLLDYVEGIPAGKCAPLLVGESRWHVSPEVGRLETMLVARCTAGWS